MPFLESCGFQCPEHKDRASFMQEVTSVVGQLEFATDDLRRAQNIPELAELQDIINGKAVNPFTGESLPVKSPPTPTDTRHQQGSPVCPAELAGRVVLHVLAITYVQHWSPASRL